MAMSTQQFPVWGITHVLIHHPFIRNTGKWGLREQHQHRGSMELTESQKRARLAEIKLPLYNLQEHKDRGLEMILDSMMILNLATSWESYLDNS